MTRKTRRTINKVKAKKKSEASSTSRVIRDNKFKLLKTKRDTELSSGTAGPPRVKQHCRLAKEHSCNIS